MSKVSKAVEAFEWLDGAQEEFNEAFNELSEAQIKEFESITGATMNKKPDNPEAELKRLQEENKRLYQGIRAALSHIVSYAFVEMYKEKVDPNQKEEWVPAVYVKEITAWVATSNQDTTKGEENAQR